ncbi:MAG: hypothetical protein EXR75_04075 [Myxococcales bacterium]|nr:hypothetical protein [Myxococcales bacterium]
MLAARVRPRHRPDTRGTITAATDLYALAHIAFALLTGRAYYANEDEASSGVYALLLKIMSTKEREPACVRAASRGVGLLQRSGNRISDRAYQSGGAWHERAGSGGGFAARGRVRCSERSRREYEYAILDRVDHNAYTFDLKGPSRRKTKD